MSLPNASSSASPIKVSFIAAVSSCLSPFSSFLAICFWLSKFPFTLFFLLYFLEGIAADMAGSKYQPIGDLEKFGSKFHDVSPRRSSTSESLGSTLMEDEDNMAPQPQPKSSRWMLLGHAVLLSLSFSMFVGSFLTRASTLTHVKQFSAYCKLRYWDILNKY
jgi:hypothetical protein